MVFSPIEIDWKVLYQIVCLVKGRYISTKYSMAIELTPVQKIAFAFIEIFQRYYFIWVGSTPSYLQLPSQGTPHWTASYFWMTGFDKPFIVD